MLVGATVEIEPAQTRAVADGVRAAGAAAGSGGCVPTVAGVPAPLSSTLAQIPSLERRLGRGVERALVTLADDIEDLVERAVTVDGS